MQQEVVNGLTRYSFSDSFLRLLHQLLPSIFVPAPTLCVRIKFGIAISFMVCRVSLGGIREELARGRKV